MIAERLPHQQRDEVAEEGPGDAREQPAETDDRAREIRRGLRGVSETASIIVRQ